jgi:Skp family chaperone for outer membrane proteins
MTQASWFLARFALSSIFTASRFNMYLFSIVAVMLVNYSMLVLNSNASSNNNAESFKKLETQLMHLEKELQASTLSKERVEKMQNSLDQIGSELQQMKKDNSAQKLQQQQKQQQQQQAPHEESKDIDKYTHLHNWYNHIKTVVEDVVKEFKLQVTDLLC